MNIFFPKPLTTFFHPIASARRVGARVAFAAILLVMAPSPVWCSPTVVHVAGASLEEQLELQDGDPGAEFLHDRIASLDETLRRHPKNRAAILLRSIAETQIGDVAGAGSDLANLIYLDPNFPGLGLARASLASVQGSVKDELAAYTLMGPIADDPSIRARVQELRGDIDGAAVIFRNETNKGGAPLSMLELGMLQLRHSDAGAIKSFQQAVIGLKQDPVYSEVAISARTDLVTANWANGRRDAALRFAMENCRDILKDSKNRYTRELLPYPAAAALILTRSGVGTAADALEVQDIAFRCRKLINTDKAQFDQLSFLAVLDVNSRPRIIKQVIETLNRAPNLDWARSAAMLLILSDEKDSADLSKLIPPNTVEQRIVIVEKGKYKLGDRE